MHVPTFKEFKRVDAVPGVARGNAGRGAWVGILADFLASGMAVASYRCGSREEACKVAGLLRGAVGSSRARVRVNQRDETVYLSRADS